jgi:mitochondrial fission protein ELM1
MAEAPMQPLGVLILSDGRPGHYHLAEGVAAAIGRRRPVVVTRLAIRRRKLAPARLLAFSVHSGAPLATVLKLGYGIDRETLPASGLVISAGGETIAANIAVARVLAAANIFCGTLRHAPPEAFSLVVSSYARHQTLPRHLVALKPNGIDPDRLGRDRAVREHGSPVYGLLVGGDSGLFHYEREEWETLVAFLTASWRATGARWIVSTSRRSPDHVADALQALAAARPSPILELIDFRTAGPGTLPRLFGSVDAILATEDSSTMISEAVCARLPVVGVAPRDHAFKDEEREYRAFMRDSNWCRFLPLGLLDPSTFTAALSNVTPLASNHLDDLSEAIAARLPELFR